MNSNTMNGPRSKSTVNYRDQILISPRTTATRNIAANILADIFTETVISSIINQGYPEIYYDIHCKQQIESSVFLHDCIHRKK